MVHEKAASLEHVGTPVSASSLLEAWRSTSRAGLGESMRAPAGRFILALGLGAASLAWAPVPQAACAAEAMAVIPGEILVRFSGATSLNETCRQAARDPNQIPRLRAQLAEELKPLGLPFSLKLVTSGEELLLVLDREKLAEQVAGLAKGTAGVERVEMIPRDERIVPSPQLEFRVLLSGAPAQRMEAARHFSAALAQSKDLPAHLRPVGGQRGQELILSVDLNALTARTIERFRNLPGVAYVQPAARVQRFKP